MSVLVPSSIIDVESSPLTSELWGLAYIFLADWSLDLKLETSYKTDVAMAESVAESRLGLVSRPYRILTARAVAFRRQEALALKMLLSRLAQSRNLAPIYTDASRLTVAASGATLDCDTQNRRFQIDGRVVVAEPNGSGQFVAFEVAEIQSFTASQITLKSSLSGSFPVGSKVMPLIEARLVLQSSWTHVNGEALEAQFVFSESTGEMALFPTVEPGTDPSGFPTSLGCPIMDRRFNWTVQVSGGVRREGAWAELGRDSVPQVFGARARNIVSGVVTSTSREDIFELLRFFESRAGRLHPFWLLSPLCDYVPTALSASGVNVEAVGPEFDWQFRPWIGVTMKDGTIHVREVDTVTRVGDSDNVTFVTVLPGAPTLSDVRSVRVAHKVRFGEDAFAEGWLTDELTNAELSLVEVLEEKSVELDELDAQPTGRRSMETMLFGVGGVIWPARPLDATQEIAGVFKLDPPALTQFTKDGSADRIGNRVVFGPFAAGRVLGIWSKWFRDEASLTVTFRLEDEETGEVLLSLPLDETEVELGYSAVNEENPCYLPADVEAFVFRNRAYRITVEASVWSALEMSQWAGKGRPGYHATQRISGSWQDVDADALALALIVAPRYIDGLTVY